MVTYRKVSRPRQLLHKNISKRFENTLKQHRIALKIRTLAYNKPFDIEFTPVITYFILIIYPAALLRLGVPSQRLTHNTQMWKITILRLHY